MNFKCFYILAVVAQINFVFTVDHCKEKNQSPVNLETSKLVPKVFNPLIWDFQFLQPMNTQTIYVNENTVRLEMKNTNVPVIRGGPLKKYYRLVQTHFHWGSKDSVGSEHTLDSKQYPMEMHAVFLKEKLTEEEALEDADGVAIIAYFIELTKESDKKSNSVLALDVITNILPKITTKNRKIATNSKVALNKLLPSFKYDYLTYRGSLTTPPCSTVVTRIISPEVLKITQSQLKAFRDLYKRKIVNHANNFRATQPLQGRKVFKAKSA